MKRESILIAAVLSLGLGATAQAAPAMPELALTRFDCGKTNTLSEADLNRFSDINAFSGLKVQLTFSCYLVKHGEDYLIWDTGLPMTAGATPNPSLPKVSLVDQLALMHLKPEQIKFVGISHYHGDHVGQLASFPQATLLIGKGDWEGGQRWQVGRGGQSGQFRALDQRRRQGGAGERR